MKILEIIDLFKYFNPFKTEYSLGEAEHISVVYSVKLHDQYWDEKTDNDDLEDKMSICEVLYTDRGKILSSRHCWCGGRISPIEEIKQFFYVCSIGPSQIWKWTAWRDAKKPDLRDLF